MGLLGSSYKILSKRFANRLKNFFLNLISPFQWVGIDGRQILDAVLIAHECVDSQHKSKRKWIIYKLDLEKTYNMVDWNFLHFVFSSMGFGKKWCIWIAECVSSAQFFLVLINVSSKGFFCSSRSLCQGDPLCPTLIIMVVEALSLVLSKATNFPLFSGFKIECSSL